MSSEMFKESLTFPLLYLNLGGELMYIIEQRLEAQSVARDKSIKGTFNICKCLNNDVLIRMHISSSQCYTFGHVKSRLGR